MDEPPEASAEHLSIRAMAARVMDAGDPATYELVHRWSTKADTWFSEVTPLVQGPAPFSLHLDGDTLNVFFAETWFELFGFTVDDVADVEQLLGGIRDGAFEQVGNVRRGRTFARIHGPRGTRRVGHAHVWPCRWRSKQRFEAYPPR